MSEKGRRIISDVWNSFTAIDKGYAACNLCQSKFSYKSTTTNLWRHLASKHPTVTSRTSAARGKTKKCEESSQKYMLMMDHIAPTETPQSPPEELPMPPPGKQWCEEVGGMDEFELLGRAWGSKLRRLSPPTRRQAERLVHEVFFLADMGDLSGQSRVVAGSRVKLIKLTSQ